MPLIVISVIKYGFRLVDSGVLAILVSISLGLPVLWLTWAIYRDARRFGADHGDLSVAEIADQLAVAVSAQWQEEAAVRRLNDPYPISVSWEPADAFVQDTWDSLIASATKGAGASPGAAMSSWDAGPAALAGTGQDLVEVISLIPTGRLVVLGEPGSGKTMLMVRLVLDLLARRSPADPVPVLASAASWNPSDKAMSEWLAEQLIIDHPGLAGAAPAPWERYSRARALIAAGLILPVIDGLDEIPPAVRGPAIVGINDAMRPGVRLVVTCRGKQFEEAVRPPGGTEVTLRGAAVIQLLPLDAATVRRYLADDAGGPVAAARWAPVLGLLDTESPCAQALRSPLMVGLARAVYNPRPGEISGATRDPAELSEAFEDKPAVESHLLDAFIPAVYRSGSAGRWPAPDAEKWLTFLARYLEKTARSPDLAWWKLRDTVPRRLTGAVITLLAGVLGGSLIGSAFGINLGPGLGAQIGIAYVGVIAVFMAWIAARTPPASPARGLRWKLSGKFWPQKTAWNTPRDSAQMKHTVRIAAILAIGVTALIFGGAPVGDDVLAGAELILWALIVVMSRGLATDTLDLRIAATPYGVVARDRKIAWSAAFLTVTVTGLMITILAFTSGAAPKLVSFFTVIYAGLVAPLLVEAIFADTAWPAYATARSWLALRRQLPWALTAFLKDAHQRGALRQAGAVYQFRHLELQHRLATRPQHQPTENLTRLNQEQASPGPARRGRAR
jgi:GTPase SAR1 family protein